MSAASETLKAVCGLAGQIPNITVLSSEALTAGARISILAKGDKAIDAIQSVALYANASIEPWLREPDENTETEQTIVVSSRERAGLEFGELQMLGIHLIWHLHKLGVLSAQDANVLLRKWGAVPVGA